MKSILAQCVAMQVPKHRSYLTEQVDNKDTCTGSVFIPLICLKKKEKKCLAVFIF